MIDISTSIATVISFCKSVFVSFWSFLSNVQIFSLEGQPFTLAHFLLGLFVLSLIVSAFSVAVHISTVTERV